MNYDRIYPCDMINGPGCRVVLFVTGCSHKCKGCYNKSTWNPRNGTEFNSDALNQIIEFMSKDYISGLTLSGGDPLYKDNRKEIYELTKKIKKLYPNKDIWLWTGYEIESIDKKLLKYIDVIIDGRFDMNKPTNKLYRGSDNQQRWLNTSGKLQLID